MCKVGRTPKEFLGIKEEQKINPDEYESICSPTTQAQVMNSAKTEFHILKLRSYQYINTRPAHPSAKVRGSRGEKYVWYSLLIQDYQNSQIE